jgi:hypothetical protein
MVLAHSALRTFYIIISLLLCSSYAIAQKPAITTPTTVNSVNAQGKKHGFWYLVHAGNLGEETYSEMGNYDNGNKTGVWYILDGTGDIGAIESYRYNVLNGEVKYFEAGKISCIGHYLGLNPAHKFDTIQVADAITGVENTWIVPTEYGTFKHGMWQYYDVVTGRLTKEMEYQMDSVIYKREFALTAADSAYYNKRRLPHTRKQYYEPPADKQYKYTRFKKY